MALVALPFDEATELFGDSQPDPTVVLDGVMRDLEQVARRDADLAAGSLAGAAIAMALEVESPFNSATSKSMCANALRETMTQIRALMPAEQETNEFDELRARRRQRLTGEA